MNSNWYSSVTVIDISEAIRLISIAQRIKKLSDKIVRRMIFRALWQHKPYKAVFGFENYDDYLVFLSQIGKDGILRDLEAYGKVKPTKKRGMIFYDDNDQA